MRFAITGGNGFLAGYLIDELLQNGHEVVLLKEQKRISDSPLRIIRRNPWMIFLRKKSWTVLPTWHPPARLPIASLSIRA